ncbi:MAG: hypothetical protein IT438_10810 [Phycisphaerales bacterium]|nr:hypothetical protein [Phycisphaerales bacterium]
MSIGARPIGLILFVIVAVGASAVLFGQSVRANQACAEDLARFDALQLAATEVRALRTTAERLRRHQESSAPRLATASSEVLAAAGLPTATLASLSPESAATERIEKAFLTRTRATLTLSPITLPQFGRFLDVWRQRLPGWTVARVDLEPRRETAASTPGGGDLPLRAVIAVESTKWDAKGSVK